VIAIARRARKKHAGPCRLAYPVICGLPYLPLFRQLTIRIGRRLPRP